MIIAEKTRRTRRTRRKMKKMSYGLRGKITTEDTESTEERKKKSYGYADCADEEEHAAGGAATGKEFWILDL